MRPDLSQAMARQKKFSAFFSSSRSSSSTDQLASYYFTMSSTVKDTNWLANLSSSDIETTPGRTKPSQVSTDPAPDEHYSMPWTPTPIDPALLDVAPTPLQPPPSTQRPTTGGKQPRLQFAGSAASSDEEDVFEDGVQSEAAPLDFNDRAKRRSLATTVAQRLELSDESTQEMKNFSVVSTILSFICCRIH